MDLGWIFALSPLAIVALIVLREVWLSWREGRELRQVQNCQADRTQDDFEASISEWGYIGERRAAGEL